MNFSKVILAMQSIFLAFFSCLGFLFVFGSVLPLLTGSFHASDFVEFFLGLVLFSFLIAGWRVYIWVLLSGPGRGKNISKIWGFLCVFGVIISLLSCLYNSYSAENNISNTITQSSRFFIFGIFFLPTAIHVGLEWLWQGKCREKS